VRIKLIAIYDRGVLTKERIHLQANIDLDLGYTVILDSEFSTATTIQAGNKNSYWFTPEKVKAGEHIVLYTCIGTPTDETRPDGRVYHFRFRGLNFPKYLNQKASATVFEVNTWETSTPGPLAFILGQLPPVPKIP